MAWSEGAARVWSAWARLRRPPAPPAPGLLLTLLGLVVGSLARHDSSLLAQGKDWAGQTPTFRSSTDVVLVDVSVRDARGGAVVDLDGEDFELREDGAPQEIVYFNREFADKPTPSSVLLLLDTSSSMKGDAILEASKAAMQFVRRIPNEAEVALIVFDHSTRIVCPFTTDRAKLETGLANLGARGGTALYDALGEALRSFDSAGHQRKILVLLSDGKDLDSRAKFSEIDRRFESSPIVVYAIGYYSESERRLYLTGERHYKEPAFEENLNPAWVLERLALLSGGLVLFPTQEQELSPFFQEIAQDLRHQYVLGYLPSLAAGKPRFRPIEVRLRDSARRGAVEVRARRGYVR